ALADDRGGVGLGGRRPCHRVSGDADGPGTVAGSGLDRGVPRVHPPGEHEQQHDRHEHGDAHDRDVERAGAPVAPGPPAVVPPAHPTTRSTGAVIVTRIGGSMKPTIDTARPVTVAVTRSAVRSTETAAPSRPLTW